MAKTKLQRECTAAVERWCKARKIELISKPHHIYPRCYVLARMGSQLIIARPWADAEPHLVDMERKLRRGFDWVHHFDESLQTSDWCTSAYICTRTWQMTCAIPLVSISD